MTGVIGHIANPTPTDVEDLATNAEAAGAAWLGLADAFWWRDVWMLLTHAAAATTRIELGPAMTNAYLRHPFHTLSALATLHELAPGRVFCGIAAGGSEVTMAAGTSRSDAPLRAAALAGLIRDVAAGLPLDSGSGRGLDVGLPRTPVLMAGRGDAMLAMAGATADRVLLWAIPASDLDRTVAVIADAASRAGRSPKLIWAPLVRHAGVEEASLGHVAVYAALNTNSRIRAGWGLDSDVLAAIRSRLVAGDTAGAIGIVPADAMKDLLVDESEADAVAERARDLGVSEIAVPGFSADGVGHQLAWAGRVEELLG